MESRENEAKLVSFGQDKQSDDLSTHVTEKPKRRLFSQDYKLKILAKLEKCRGKHGAVGDLLRAEGLYSTQVANWKAELEGGLSGVFTKKRGPKANPATTIKNDLAKANRENERLRRRLREAEAIIDIQKKLSALLGIKLPTEGESEP